MASSSGRALTTTSYVSRLGTRASRGIHMLFASNDATLLFLGIL